MQIKYRILPMLIMLCLVMGFFPTTGVAAEGVSTDAALPRAFQNVQLGMTLSEFTAVVPEAKPVSLGGHEQADHTVVVPSQDRPLHRIEYRFSERLREFVLYYVYADVPGGYAALLEQLRESYGKPVRQNLQEYYTKPEAYSEKKTIWKDRATMATLTEIRKLNGDRRELSLTITDLTGQPALAKGQARHAHERSIPIPVPEDRTSNEQTAVPDRAGHRSSRHVAEGVWGERDPDLVNSLKTTHG